MTAFTAIRLDRGRRRWTATLDRPRAKNAITPELVRELGLALDAAEADSECRLMVLSGSPEAFCTGMDFRAALAQGAAAPDDSGGYARLLARFARSPRFVVSVVEGKVLAGGVGFVAASDLVVATPAATFGLSELLWGLLPAQVLPWLVRRIGFQRAYAMTLTMQTVDAETAARWGLVDQLCGDPEEELRKLEIRLSRVEPTTIGAAKRWFGVLWPVEDEISAQAASMTDELLRSSRVQRNIRAYVEHGKFPWEN